MNKQRRSKITEAFGGVYRLPGRDRQIRGNVGDCGGVR